MPIDQYEDHDEDERSSPTTGRQSFKEFDCPSCNANNPCDPPLSEGDEILCNYCGSEYQVRVTDGGKLRLREI
jgi:transcription elongation factor Elf1